MCESQIGQFRPDVVQAKHVYMTAFSGLNRIFQSIQSVFLNKAVQLLTNKPDPPNSLPNSLTSFLTTIDYFTHDLLTGLTK